MEASKRSTKLNKRPVGLEWEKFKEKISAENELDRLNRAREKATGDDIARLDYAIDLFRRKVADLERTINDRALEKMQGMPR